MIIYFSPISMFASYTLEVAAGSVVIDGVQHNLADLAALGDDDVRPPFVVSATVDSVTLLLPYWGPTPDSVLHPDPVMDPPLGDLELPA